ncbi:hypothetical protein GCM10022631_00040 [Deinococcus rubellus]
MCWDQQGCRKERGRFRRGGRWFGLEVGGRCDRTARLMAQFILPGKQRRLNGILQIFQQVPAICNLNGLGRTLSGSIGIHTRPISRDDLQAGMPTQPVGDRCGTAIQQQINNLVCLQIDQDGAVGQAFAVRPIIDTEHPSGGRRWEQRLPNDSQEFCAIDWHCQDGGQAHPTPSTRMETQ